MRVKYGDDSPLIISEGKKLLIEVPIISSYIQEISDAVVTDTLSLTDVIFAIYSLINEEQMEKLVGLYNSVSEKPIQYHGNLTFKEKKNVGI